MFQLTQVILRKPKRVPPRDRSASQRSEVLERTQAKQWYKKNLKHSQPQWKNDDIHIVTAGMISVREKLYNHGNTGMISVSEKKYVMI